MADQKHGLYDAGQPSDGAANLRFMGPQIIRLISTQIYQQLTSNIHFKNQSAVQLINI